MKKIILTLMTLTMCAMLCACGNDHTGNGSAATASPIITMQPGTESSPIIDQPMDEDDGIVDDRDGIINDNDTGRDNSKGGVSSVSPSPSATVKP